MEEKLEIKLHLDSENKGGWYIEQNNRIVARMEIKIEGDKIIVYHTEVDEGLKGLNIGSKLLDEMVSYARSHDMKIFPYCPFVRAQFRRHEEKYQDVWLLSIR